MNVVKKQSVKEFEKLAILCPSYTISLEIRIEQKYSHFIFDNQNSPDGRKFRSRNELRQYLEKHNLDYPAEDFDFSIWGRGNRPTSKNSSNV